MEVESELTGSNPQLSRRQLIKAVLGIALAIALAGLVRPTPIQVPHFDNEQTAPKKVSAVHRVKKEPAVKVAKVVKPKHKQPERKPLKRVVVPGTCASEIHKYNWNKAVATNVMLTESSGIATRVNDNPATGDYSVGCFQINLYGANAITRPSESWLKNPTNNVSYAYSMYKTQGWNPWSFTTCKIVACY